MAIQCVGKYTYLEISVKSNTKQFDSLPRGFYNEKQLINLQKSRYVYEIFEKEHLNLL